MSDDSYIIGKTGIKNIFKFLLSYPDVTDVKSAQKCQKHVKLKAWIMIGVFGFVLIVVCIIELLGFLWGSHIIMQIAGKIASIKFFFIGFPILLSAPVLYAIGILRSWKIKYDDSGIVETLSSLPHRMYSGECAECSKYNLDRNVVLRFLQEFVENKSHDEFAEFLYLFGKDHTNAELITGDLNKVYEDYNGCLSCVLLCVFSNPQYFTIDEKVGLSEYFLNFETNSEKEIDRVFCISAIKNINKYENKPKSKESCIINNLGGKKGKECSCGDDKNQNCQTYKEYRSKCILLMHYIILNIVSGVKIRIVLDKERNNSIPYVDYVIGIYMDTDKNSYSTQKLYVSFEDPKYVKSTENKVLIWKDRLLLSVLKRDFNKRWHRGMAQNATKQVYDICEGQSIKHFLESLNIRKENDWVNNILKEAFNSVENIDSINYKIINSTIYNNLKTSLLS